MLKSFVIIIIKHPEKLVKRKDTIYVVLTYHLKQFINKISITSPVTDDETNNFITNRMEGPTLQPIYKV